MNLMTLVDMALAGHGERTAFGSREGGGLTYRQLHDRAAAGAALLRSRAVEHLVFLAPNGTEFPIALFAAAWAGLPLVSLNYRLGHDQLSEQIAAHPSSLVIVNDDQRGNIDLGEREVLTSSEWLAATQVAVDEPVTRANDPDTVAVLLYTSGTTSSPKAAVLRHRHLSAYVLGTVEFGSAAATAASLVTVPPYHVAGLANTLSNVYSGRRVVHLPSFTPAGWLDAVRRERITHALVVPTMLAQVVEHLETIGADDAGLPTLESLAYGGAPMPTSVIARALALFGSTDFVNAYGLTETSSTIALLGPQDHRLAAASSDPAVRARLGSAGLIVPGIEVAIRDPAGTSVTSGVGDLFVRGEQVSGEYLGEKKAADREGWFATRDRASMDPDGYLFIEGRADDTIIRGGENIAPAEIEEILVTHDDVASAAVVGLSDDRWGQIVAAVVVPEPGATVDTDGLREWARIRLRTSKTPERIEVRAALPVTETGKLLRRVLIAELESKTSGADAAKETPR